MLLPGLPTETEDEEGEPEDLQAGGGSSGRAATVAKLTDSDVDALRVHFPFLRELSTGYIKSLTPGELLCLEKASIKQREVEKNKDPEDKLTHNRMALGINTMDVKAGVDDWLSKLHEGRFLPGAGCSATRMWLAAREIIGLTGYPPISTYDMGAVGLAGYVLAEGWVHIANPASPKLSVKMFNISNMTARPSGSRATAFDTDEMAEFTELSEFRLALRAMRTAMGFCMPWNKSIEALEGFLLNSRFCMDEMQEKNVEKPALLLTRYTDFILKENSNKWRNMEGFITCGEQRTYWNSFFSAVPISAKKKTTYKTKTGTATKRTFVDICFAWNRGQCSRAPGTCRSRMGTVLRHVCDQQTDPNDESKRCEQEHQRASFHK